MLKGNQKNLDLNHNGKLDSQDFKMLRGKMATGGALKPIPKDNKGLPNLPEKVRNNMGYMKKGGKAKAPKRSDHAIEMDSMIKAKKPGKRVSASGNVYYESRPDHSDENRKKKPYLEHGGEMKKGGKTKAPKRSNHAMELDAAIKAKKPGKRVSASGNVYYESRPNHSDENRKKKPFLEEGGEVKGSNWTYSIGGL